jgi:alpha-ribazole phosphatase
MGREALPPSEDRLWVYRQVMAARLLLVRHAHVEPCYADHYVGRTDVPLSADGLRKAAALAPLVKSRGPERCFCSPLARARQTAEVLCGPAGLAIQIDEDLREVDFGDWEAKTFREIAAESPAAVTRWAESLAGFVFPGGESLDGFFGRVRRAAERLAVCPAPVALVVTHGGVIRSLLCHFLGLGPRHFLLFGLRHAACTTIDVSEGRGVLSGLNEHDTPEAI